LELISARLSCRDSLRSALFSALGPDFSGIETRFGFRNPDSYPGIRIRNTFVSRMNLKIKN
jgi:hypothetical protein